MTFPILIAFTVTAVTLALLRRSGVAQRMGDIPNERSMHVEVVPRIGGIGILVGLAAAWVAVPTATPSLDHAAAGYVALFAVSLADDLRPLPVVARLASHLIVAAACFWAAGYSLWMSAVGALTVAWSTNLYNFMDGSDGLAGGMAAFGFGTYAVAAFLGNDLHTATLCASAAAAALAFLLFNFHPASLFLGDSGSIPLGFLAGVVGWYGIATGLWPWSLPVLAFFPFLFDASYTLLRRISRGERPWQAHREHLYQRAIRGGLGHRNVALRAYVIMGCTTAAGLMSMPSPEPLRIGVVALASAAGLWLGLRIDHQLRHATQGTSGPIR